MLRLQTDSSEVITGITGIDGRERTTTLSTADLHQQGVEFDTENFLADRRHGSKWRGGSVDSEVDSNGA